MPPGLSDEALVERIRYFEEQGADLIDLGASLDATPASVKRALKKAKEVTALPISIDAVRPELICAGIEAGADMILSLNGENLPLVGRTGGGSGHTGGGHTGTRIGHIGGEPGQSEEVIQSR